MIKISGNTVIPFVTWAHTPPDHQITSILLSEDGESVATGSADGNIILWSIGNSCSCAPRWMLTGHKSLVSNLCIAGRSPITKNQFFFSYSINGEMAVWNWNDGKCLEFKMDTRYRHTYIKSHQTCYLDYRLLFCCGQYAHIVVLHATSLAVLFTLASNSQPDWISSFVVVTHPNQRNEIVLGLSYSNLAVLWTLDGEETQGEAKYEHESRSINCPSTIIQVDCCPQTPRCILLVCSSGWQLFDAMTCSINCTVSNPTNDVLVGGSFIQSNVISVYGQSGFVYLYSLPKSLIIYSRDSIYTDVPVHIATFSSSITDSKYHSNIISPNHSLLDDSLTASPITNQILCNDNDSNNNGNDNLSVTVCIQLNQMTTYQRVQGSPPTIHPYRLAFGLSNGRIIIVRMVDFLKTIYWHHDHPDNSQDDQFPMQHHNQLSKFCLNGHIGPVTSLLHPASCERQSYSSNDSNSVNYNNNGDSMTTTNNNISSTITDYQFNPDFLLSGGMDFTVRLWDLNSWYESTGNNISSSGRKYVGNNCSKSLCLSVYRCHASPCIGLTIGPPISSVINMVAGNPRLSTTICSFGADGSVWLINLKEKRPFLYARNTSNLSSCPVVAIGWRLAEDLLLINYLDGTVTVWDINMGCLERIETEQSARDLFEQAQFITEVYHPSTFLSFTFSTLPSITMSSYKSRSLAGVPNQYSVYTSLATPFCGGVNSTCSSGTIHLTAPSRLKYSTIDDLQKLCTNNLPPVQLYLIGSRTVTNSQDKVDINNENQLKWNSGPAAFVFHWDIESLIETTPTSSSSLYRDDIFTMDVTQATFLQIIISLIHPWGIDLSMDEIIQKLCHNHQTIDKDKLKTLLNNSRQQLRTHKSPICVGLISKCGCMSLSMPGYCTKSTTISKSGSIQQIPHPYCLSSIISTNLILSGVSLTELMTSLNWNYLLRLSHTIFGDNGTGLSLSSSSSKCLSDSNINITILSNWRIIWLQFGAFLLEHFIGLILSNKYSSYSDEKLRPIPPPIELNLFARKWQDRCLPIRYAARTLLLSCLDQLSLDDRKLLVTYWSALLPPFALTNQKQQQSQRQLIQQNSLDSANRFSYQIIDILAHNNHTEEKIVHKQQGTPSKQQFSTDSLPNLTESVSLSSLTSNLNMSIVLDSSWWMTLNGYRISPREHARLQRDIQKCQAIAIILMGVIGVRFGSSTKRRHPAVVVRDLITQPLVMTKNRTYEVMNYSNCGLASPCFAAPDNDDNNDREKSEMTKIAAMQVPFNQSEEVPLSVQKFSQYSSNQSSEIQDGFGLDNNYLARSTYQCLSALLFNGGYPVLLPTDINNPEIDWNKFHEQIVGSRSEVLPVHAANALITLLTSNMNSTLRRAAIDLLGRGFPVWEPYVDVGHVINVLLLLAADAEMLLSSNKSCQLISDRVDLARTAREALWAIGFARPKLITLALSLEVRRFGAQINAAASAITSNSGRSSISTSSPSNSNHIQSSWSLTKSLSKDSDNHHLVTMSRRDSITIGNEFQSSTASSNMVVMMTNPIVATPVFSSNAGVSGSNTGTNSNRSATTGYGGSFVFGKIKHQCCCFHAYSSHTRLQKACTGGVNGSLTFYDFKIGRYFVTMGHKGPVTAICFNFDGRQVATYSLAESTLRIWQLHTTGFFGMGGQQVKPLSIHPVPPLIPPPPPSSTSSLSRNEFINNNDMNKNQSTLPDRLEVWIDWPESRVLHLVTNIGIRRRIAL
ncbi:hypothetical protein Smp_156160 [Schistosoma mansoni]|uniref:hypothetical protein n=1 Tax=Schistosoma mansoni TaxID=6183 RepID=UPI00022DC1C2|nr:hypothetical protein Smp_156160 [Schistosoma mansoni]|eukprot:XP_018653285.1 hypothetical protein Smp_156160 [Schistosoma mansoni]